MNQLCVYASQIRSLYISSKTALLLGLQLESSSQLSQHKEAANIAASVVN